MTAEEFRRLALGMGGAAEGEHMSHPDFRVRGKVFATIGYPDAGWAMVKLTPEQQEILVGAEPGVFRAANGAWGRRGATLLRLEAADAATATSAIRMAWSNINSK